MARSVLLFCIGFVSPVLLAGERVAESPPAPAVGELIAGLDSPDRDRQLEAIEALGERGAEAAKAVGVLLKQLEAEDPAIRGAAAEALGKIGAEGDKVVPALIGRFSDAGYLETFEPVHKVVPLFAVYAMSAGSFGEAAVDSLIEALRSDVQQEYLGAAIGLEAAGAPAVKAMPQLLQMLRNSDAMRRNAAAGAIRGIGPGAAEAIPELTRLLHAENFHTQYWACRALGAIGPASAPATGDLRDLLADGAASVRRNAALALGNIGPGIGPEAAADLVKVVDKEFMAPVREAAVIALGQLKPYAKQSVPVLRRVLGEPNFPAPTQAARSLWLLTGDANEAAAALAKAMDDLTYFQDAVAVLAEMGPAAAPAVDRLIKALDERDPDDRVTAALALPRIGPSAKKAEPKLRNLLEDKEPHVRKAAKAAMEAISNMP